MVRSQDIQMVLLRMSVKSLCAKALRNLKKSGGIYYTSYAKRGLQLQAWISNPVLDELLDLGGLG